MKKQYDIVIGLEIHAELNTKSKIFCSCKNSFGESPNTNCCPVCMGFPGTLPILNKKAVEKTITAGLACGSQINEKAVFERKNYFYPDLSKAYQISQLAHPICLGGGIKLSNGKFVRLNRIHLEEDAGKLIHSFSSTEVDYNRGGLALMEAVTEPDISSADEAVEFLTKLRDLFVFSGVGKCRMEKGEMRCDVNLSIKEKGSKTLGERTEMKNLNSFRSIHKAIQNEAKRQIDLIESGQKVLQETRKWDDEKEQNTPMRSKEDTQDYRYFPDPDILEVKIDKDFVKALKEKMPMLAHARREKYVNEFNLPQYDADVLTSSKTVSDFFNQAVELLNQPKEISNWIMTDIMKLIVDDVIPISATHLVDIIQLVLQKKITRNNAKDLLESVCKTKSSPLEIAKKSGMLETISQKQIEQIVEMLIEANQSSALQYAENQNKIMQFFMGRVMKETRGKADPTLTQKVIAEKLSKLQG